MFCGINLFCLRTGMLKMQNKVLKPINKIPCGKTEIKFYEELDKTADPHLRELKNFVPRFHGTETINIDGNKQVECIVLDDVTRDIKEPCILDIKIGRKTYDPFASYEKIIKEDQKYHETKRDLGFCIPGFQVHKIDSGRIRKFGKDYGKQLNRETIRDGKLSDFASCACFVSKFCSVSCLRSLLLQRISKDFSNQIIFFLNPFKMLILVKISSFTNSQNLIN